MKLCPTCNLANANQNPSCVGCGHRWANVPPPVPSHLITRRPLSPSQFKAWFILGTVGVCAFIIFVGVVYQQGREDRAIQEKMSREAAAYEANKDQIEAKLKANPLPEPEPEEFIRSAGNIFPNTRLYLRTGRGMECAFVILDPNYRQKDGWNNWDMLVQYPDGGTELKDRRALILDMETYVENPAWVAKHGPHK